MSKFFKKVFGNPRKTNLPKSAVEAGPRKKERYPSFAVCKKCHDVYYKKSWHYETDFLNDKELDGLEIKSVLCPADTMVRDGLYEGMMRVEDVPQKYRVELLNLIKGYGRRARMRDSQVRIIEIIQKKGEVVVTTTENQLASKLGKKIKETFKNVEVNISHSKEPYQVTRVDVVFI